MQKKCITCLSSKPHNEFSLRRAGGTVRRNECKECHAKREKKRRAGKLTPKITPEPTGTVKICTACLEEKDLIFFDKNPSNSKGVHSQCKPCRSARNAEYILKQGQEERGQDKWYEQIHPPREMIIPAVIQAALQ